MKQKIEKYILNWEKKCYFNGIPDEVPQRIEQLNKAPSYKQIAKAIMKNDFQLQTLGFTRPINKVYYELKRCELINRGVIKPNNQLKLKL